MRHPAEPTAQPGGGQDPASVAGGIHPVVLLWIAFLLGTGSIGAGGIAFRATRPGLSVAHVVRDEPWSLHVVRVDRGHPGLGFFPSLALHDRIGLNPLSEQVALFPKSRGTVEAAINGDFYALENDPLPGDPRGLFIQHGGLVSGPVERDCLWFDTSGAPHIDTVRPRFTVRVDGSGPVTFGLNEDFDGSRPVVLTHAASAAPDPWDPSPGWVLVRDGSHPWLPLAPGRTLRATVRGPARAGRPEITPDTLVLRTGPDLRRHLHAGSSVVLETATEPSLTGAVSALGGGPALVHLGRPTGKSAARSAERHPRSAFGWNVHHGFLVVVDGRQAGLSVGMTLAELSEFLVELGCQEAINLDGGGSTELILGGEILNSPCYGRERATATSLLVVRAPAEARPAGNTGPPGDPAP